MLVHCQPITVCDAPHPREYSQNGNLCSVNVHVEEFFLVCFLMIGLGNRPLLVNGLSLDDQSAESGVPTAVIRGFLMISVDDPSKLVGDADDRSSLLYTMYS